MFNDWTSTINDPTPAVIAATKCGGNPARTAPGANAGRPAATRITITIVMTSWTWIDILICNWTASRTVRTALATNAVGFDNFMVPSF
jgi:hypothetical protein